jgi:hypothetical protein
VLRGIDKDVRKLLLSAEAQGCVVVHTRSLHIRVVAPDGRTTILPGTTHPSKAAERARARLRRIGVFV